MRSNLVVYSETQKRFHLRVLSLFGYKRHQSFQIISGTESLTA